MQNRAIQTTDVPRSRPFNEAEEVLQDLAELEVALAAEVERLARVRAPKTVRSVGESYRGRPVWWWRAMLVSWAFALKTERAHPNDVLRALRDVARHFSDAQFRLFLEQICGASDLPPAA